MRTFVGLEVQSSPALQLARRDLKRMFGARVTPVAPEFWHVTLAFLGDQDEQALAQIDDALATLEPPRLGNYQLTSRDCFPNTKRAHLLYYGIQSDGLLELAARVRSALDPFLADRKTFVPHVTIGRAKARLDATDWTQVVSPRTTVGSWDCMTLFSSERRPDGAVYRPLHRYGITGRA